MCRRGETVQPRPDTYSQNHPTVRMAVDDETSDRALIGRARTGDRVAFGLLYDRHARPVFLQAYSVLGDVPAAEDVVQETFVTAWRKLGSIPTAGSAPTVDSALPWLLVTAKYTALNHRRGTVRRDRRTAEMPADVPAPGDTESAALAAEVRAEIARAVAALSPTDRQIYELCLADGLTYAQAADRLGLTHASVRNRLSRVRTRLRADLRAIKESS